jgi:hypothetical protein
MGYIKQHKKLRLMFECGYPKVDEGWFQEYDWYDFYCDAKQAMPPNMPERGYSVVITFLWMLIMLGILLTGNVRLEC